MEKLLKAIDDLLKKNPAMLEKVHAHIMQKMNKKNVMKCPECGHDINAKGEEEDYDEMETKEIADKEMSKDALEDLELMDEEMSE